jgi:hypothetical protein
VKHAMSVHDPKVYWSFPQILSGESEPAVPGLLGAGAAAAAQDLAPSLPADPAHAW